MCVSAGMHTLQCIPMWRLEENMGVESPLPQWVPEIRVKVPGCRGSTFTHYAMSLACDLPVL